MQKKVYTVLYYELYILKEIAFVMGRDGGWKEQDDLCS